MVNDNSVNNKKALMANQFGLQRVTLCLCFLVVSLFFSVHSFAVNIDVSVDRNPVSLNESFKLVFSASESPDDEPDFSPLDNYFQVLNQQKNSQSSWVNGESKRRISWTLNVMARQAGQLQIPAISFGDDSSENLSINVIATTVGDKMTVNDDLYLQVDVSPKQQYVQSQLLYTIRLFQRIQISQASLSEPMPENAIVEKIGQDGQYNTKVNGVNYSVFERKYAIFPQQSGPLNIPPIVLTAQVVTGGQTPRYGSLFNTQRTQTKRVQSKAINVDVRPAPDTFTGQHWLAAEKVQLQQTWSNDDLSIAVGEPLTRTITMLGNGVTASQLPELSSAINSPQLKMYPDQPVLKNQLAATGVVAMREQKIAIIPSRAGEYQLPAIEVPWFNTTTGLMEIAVIPETSITAVAIESVEIPKVIAKPIDELVIETQTTDKTVAVNTASNNWKWLSLMLAVGWVLTIIWILKKRHIKKQLSQASFDVESASIKKVVKRLQNACAVNDAKKAKQALLQWGYLLYNTDDLDLISVRCSASLQTEIKHLNESLYAKRGVEWKGATLATLVLVESRSLQNNTKQVDELELLNRL